jgi:hypothetical protein
MRRRRKRDTTKPRLAARVLAVVARHHELTAEDRRRLDIACYQKFLGNPSPRTR